MIRSERFWVLLLAGVTFLAGLGAGVLASFPFQPAFEPGPFQSFESRFRETFDLDDQAAQDLHYVLGRYHAELESLKAERLVDLEPQIIQLGQTCRERVRKYVVPADRLAEFDAMVAGIDPRLAHSQ